MRYAASPVLPAEGYCGLLCEAWHRYRGILPAHPGQVERHDHQRWQEGTPFSLDPQTVQLNFLDSTTKILPRRSSGGQFSAGKSSHFQRAEDECDELSDCAPALFRFRNPLSPSAWRPMPTSTTSS